MKVNFHTIEFVPAGAGMGYKYEDWMFHVYDAGGLFLDICAVFCLGKG